MLGTRRYRRFAAAVAVIVMLLVVGQIRLPLAVIAGLADYDLIRVRDYSILYVDDSRLDAFGLQRWWLEFRLPPPEPGNGPPSVSVQIKWNWLVVARAKSGMYIGNLGAEGRDSLYLWCFGAWIRVYDFVHVMA